MSDDLVDKEIVSASQEGSIYSGEGTVVARSETHWLVWFKGGTVYLNRMSGSAYSAGQLVLRGRDRGWHDNKKLVDGGSLKKVKWDTIREDIDAKFGEGATTKIAEAAAAGKSVLFGGGGKPLPLSHARVLANRSQRYEEHKPDQVVDLGPSECRCRQCGAEIARKFESHYLGYGTPEPGHPRTLEDCQRLTNYPVVRVRGYGENYTDRDGYIQSYDTWDGESYMDPDFCNNTCAGRYARRAVAVLPRDALPVIPPEPEEPREPRAKFKPIEYDPVKNGPLRL